MFFSSSNFHLLCSPGKDNTRVTVFSVVWTISLIFSPYSPFLSYFSPLHPSLPQISYLIEPHGFVINCMITYTEWKCKSSHSVRLHACQIWKSIYLTSASVKSESHAMPREPLLSFFSILLPPFCRILATWTDRTVKCVLFSWQSLSWESKLAFH